MEQPDPFVAGDDAVMARFAAMSADEVRSFTTFTLTVPVAPLSDEELRHLSWWISKFCGFNGPPHQYDDVAQTVTATGANVLSMTVIKSTFNGSDSKLEQYLATR